MDRQGGGRLFGDQFDGHRAVVLGFLNRPLGLTEYFCLQTAASSNLRRGEAETNAC
jgi:hypothetical protein